MRKLLFGAAAAGLLLSASSALAQLPQPSLAADEANPRLMEGLKKVTLDVGGVQRVFFVHVPDGLKTPAPVLFELHGGRGTAPRRSAQTGFNQIADRDRFIAVYPQGMRYQWNNGRQADNPASKMNSVDDIAFFRAMIDRFVSTGQGDPKRIYVVGGSDGGMMTQRLACDLGDRFAAVTAIVSSLPAPTARACKPKRPIPVLMMNGTEDPLILFAGGPVARQPENGRTIPVMDTVNFWRTTDGCTADVSHSDIPDRDPADGIRTEVFTWSHCHGGAEVQFFKMNGAGHGLPGRSKVKPRDAELAGGKSTNDFDSSEEAWKFMRQFKLP